MAHRWPWFSRYLESVKSVNYIYQKRLVIVHLKRYYNKVCNSIFIFFNVPLFCFKRYSESLFQLFITVFYHVSCWLHLRIFHQPELAILFINLMEWLTSRAGELQFLGWISPLGSVRACLWSNLSFCIHV